MHEAGRKMIVPLMGQLNHTQYFKAILLDIERYRFRAPEEVKKFARSHLSFGTRTGSLEGPDFLVENSIKRIKPCITGHSKENIMVATRLAEEKTQLRDMVLCNAGHKPMTYRRERKPTVLHNTLKLCSKDISKYNPFMSSDNQLRKINGDILPESSRIDLMHSSGLEDCKKFLKDHKTLPKRVKLQFQEQMKDNTTYEEDDTDQMIATDIATSLDEDDVATGLDEDE